MVSAIFHWLCQLRHDIAEILLKLVLNTNQSIILFSMQNLP